MYRHLLIALGCLLSLLFATDEASGRNAAGLTPVSQNFTFTNIDSTDGLPHQQVNAIAADLHGRIWIATRNGLARYDGYSVETFHIASDSIHHKNANNIYGLMVDHDGYLWVSSPDLLTRYDERTDTYKRYPLEIGRTNQVKCNSKGEIFVAGRNIYRYDAEADTFIRYDRPGNKFIVSMDFAPDDRLFVATSDEIRVFDSQLRTSEPFTGIDTSEYLTGRDGIVPLKFDSAGRLWIGLNGHGMAMYNPADGKSVIYGPSQLPDGIVRVISEDSRGNILAGTEKGIGMIHPDATIESIQYNPCDPYSLSDNALRDIYVDSHDNIWVGSYFGGVDVCYSNRSGIRWLKEGLTPGFDSKVVREIVPDATGRMWVATEDAGLYTFDIPTGRFTRFHNSDMGYNVHSLCLDPMHDCMWVGTFRNGLFRVDPHSMQSRRYVAGSESGLASDAIFSIAQRSNGELFFGTTQGLFKYNAETDKFECIVINNMRRFFCYCLFCDSDDNVWVGTTQYGLFCIDPDDNITQWIASDREPEFAEDWITSVFRDSHGTLWIGTNNSGLFTLSSPKGHVRPFVSDPDLSSRTICSIREDNSGDIWVGSSFGLYRIDPSNGKVTRFSSEDGLPTNQFNYASAALGPDSLMYMGTVRGLVAFDPADFDHSHEPLDVHLLCLTVNQDEMRAGKPDSVLSEAFDFVNEITLTYDQARSLTIEYGAVSPGDATSIRYQVWLEGVDKGWRSVGNERKLMALNLSPGTHRLHIRAIHHGDSWENAHERTLKIKVLPPIWRSKWAIAIYVLLLVAIGYLIYKLVNRRRRVIMENRMAKLNQENLNQVNREKMDFFTRVSHELKTPLSLIIAPLKQAADTSKDETCSHHVAVAMKHASRMAKIIDELITFNKVESGNFQFYLEYGNPIEFCYRAAAQFRESAAGRDISLIINCEDNGEESWFSPLYVERITNNLLSNALKFTLAEGKIFYTARIVAGDTPETARQSFLEITVRDTGIGMVKTELNRIFDVYYQTKRGLNFNNKGWGLGLFLVKRLVEIHKGTISVESAPGEGSCFTVRLNISNDAFPATDKVSDDRRLLPVSNYDFDPLTMAETLTLNADDQNVADNESLLTILIVEDDEDLLSFLSHFFSHNYNVVTATNGVEGLKVASEQRVDLIVSDVMMPEMDGVTMCNRIKTDISLSHIPVILLTAKSQSDDIVRGYENGADAYVAKPFDPHILDLQVKNIIKARRSRQEQLIQDSQSPEVEAASLSAVDRDFIARLNQLIDDNLDNSEFCVNDVISALGVSRSLLYNKMKSLTDHSIGDYIRKKRLRHACKLLLSDMAISEVAYRTGFADPNYFSKAFRREFGVSPTEYITRTSTPVPGTPSPQDPDDSNAASTPE